MYNQGADNLVQGSVSGGSSQIPPTSAPVNCGGVWWGGNWYPYGLPYGWPPYQQPYTTVTVLPAPTLPHRVQIALEVLRAGLGTEDPLTVTAREIVAELLRA